MDFTQENMNQLDFFINKLKNTKRRSLFYKQKEGHSKFC